MDFTRLASAAAAKARYDQAVRTAPELGGESAVANITWNPLKPRETTQALRSYRQEFGYTQAESEQLAKFQRRQGLFKTVFGLTLGGIAAKGIDLARSQKSASYPLGFRTTGGYRSNEWDALTDAQRSLLLNMGYRLEFGPDGDASYVKPGEVNVLAGVETAAAAMKKFVKPATGFNKDKITAPTAVTEKSFWDRLVDWGFKYLDAVATPQGVLGTGIAVGGVGLGTGYAVGKVYSGTAGAVSSVADFGTAIVQKSGGYSMPQSSFFTSNPYYQR